MKRTLLAALALPGLLAACAPSLPTPITAEAIGTYEVRRGDSVFSIAETFGLQPQTVILSNFAVLGDDPHSLTPGMRLTILPVDGLYYEWQAGDTVEAVAARFGVEPIVIVAGPGNRLDLEAYLEGRAVEIPLGSQLVIPGGSRELAAGS